jgi:hypothetical protein
MKSLRLQKGLNVFNNFKVNRHNPFLKKDDNLKINPGELFPDPKYGSESKLIFTFKKKFLKIKKMNFL